MDDQFPKDENSAKVDFVVPESSPGEGAVSFSAKVQQEKFVAGGASTNMEGKTDLEIQKAAQDTIPNSPQSEIKTPEALKSKEAIGHKIKYEFFFAPHNSPTDMKGLEERFRQTDIYIPESARWTQEQLNVLRDVANGKIDVTQKIPGEEDGSPSHRWNIQFLRMIYNSHKPITLADVPKAEHKEWEVARTNWNGTFSDILISAKEQSANILQASREREQHILDHLEPRVKELIGEHPSLKDKKEINVLLSLGLAHDPIYIDLKKRGGETVRFFGQSSPVFSFMEEGARRLRFNKPIEDDLASKMYLEMIFNGSFGRDIDKMTEDTMKSVKLSRKILRKFSFEEARQIFESIKIGQDPRLVMETKLKEKNINLPQSEKEMDEFLAKPTPKNNPALNETS